MIYYDIGIHGTVLKVMVELEEAEQILMKLKEMGIIGAYMDERGTNDN